MNRYIIPILLVTLSASIYVSIIDSTYTDIRRQQEKESELIKNLEDVKQVNVTLAKIKESYDAFPVGSEQALSTILPDKIDPIKFIIEIEEIARIHGLILKGPRVSSPDENDSSPYGENHLTFSVSAPYSVFHEFIKDLQDSRALRDMTNVGFAAKTADTNEKNQRPEAIVYDYSVSITSYSFHP